MDTTAVARLAILGGLVVSVGSSCARSHLRDRGGSADDTGAADHLDGGASDEEVERCRPIFEACDGTVEDCARAFETGCACGPPPAYVIATGENVTARNVRAAGGRVAVEIHERRPGGGPVWVSLRDVTGARELRRFDGGLRSSFGDWVFVDSMMRYQVTDGAMDVAPRRAPLEYFVAIAPDELVTARVIGVDDGIRFGVYHWGETDLDRTAEIDDSTFWPYDLQWDGERAAYINGVMVVLYDPRENVIHGPIEVSSRRAHSRLRATEYGWLAGYVEKFGRWHEYGTVELYPLGPLAEALGPPITLEPPVEGMGVMDLAVHGSEALVAYTRFPGRLTEKHIVVQWLDPRAGPLGPPLVVATTTGTYGEGVFVRWAGYSFVVVYDGTEPGVGRASFVRRVCPSSTP